MSTEHIVQSYDDELANLTNAILQMGGLVESQITATVSAITNRDSAAAEKIIENDREIDELEVEVERQVVSMLALRQPMADDLRAVIGALRISSDLERMGDLAANIAKRTIALSSVDQFPALSSLRAMALIVQTMVKNSLDAFIDNDHEKAMSTWREDEKVDELYNSMFRELLTYMFEDPKLLTTCTHLLFVAKNMERIGDHVTNICEIIHYHSTGERTMGDRPKADTTSLHTPAEGQNRDQ